MSWLQELGEDLQARKAERQYRRRRVVEGSQGPVLQIDGQSMLAFCSNDYLGLAADPRIAEALRQATLRYGSGSGAAHLISGHSAAHHALEEELADFLGTERALLFSTGYMANLGVISGLLGRADSIVQDKLNHASLLDAARLSSARLWRYRHADTQAASQRLQQAQGRVLLATDGVFSMDGDIAPLAELAQSASAAGAALMVDDAHGFGVLGPHGKGSVQAAGLSAGQVPIYMATLGKALGVAGAFVAGDAILIETLIQKARSYIFTTAMPPALAEAVRTSLRIVASEDWRRERLEDLIGRLRAGAAQLGLPMLPSCTPIQPILLQSNERAVRWSEALRQLGLLVPAIRPPTVPPGSARLRITLSASHTPAQVDRLLEALAQLAQREAA